MLFQCGHFTHTAPWDSGSVGTTTKVSFTFDTCKAPTLHLIPVLKFAACLRGCCQGIPSYAVCNMIMETVHQSGSAHCFYRASESPEAPVSGALAGWIQGIPFWFVSIWKQTLDHWLCIGFQPWQCLEVPLQRLNWAHLENKKTTTER